MTWCLLTTSALCDMQWSRVRRGHAVHGRRIRFWGYCPCTDCTGQGNEFEENSTVKMERRHPVEGYLIVDFRWSVITAELFGLKSQYVEFLTKILRFCGKTTTFGEVFKILFQKNHCDTDRRVVCKFSEICTMENRWSRALFTWQKKQNLASLSSSRYCADRAQNLPTMYSECSRFHPYRFTTIFVELYAKAWTSSKRAVKWVQYSAEAIA